jgi:hypothetical protein
MRSGTQMFVSIDHGNLGICIGISDLCLFLTNGIHVILRAS